jgi:hypothetical protein
MLPYSQVSVLPTTEALLQILSDAEVLAPPSPALVLPVSEAELPEPFNVSVLPPCDAEFLSLPDVEVLPPSKAVLSPSDGVLPATSDIEFEVRPCEDEGMCSRWSPVVTMATVLLPLPPEVMVAVSADGP